MHALHKILVNLKTDFGEYDVDKNYIRAYAKKDTEYFGDGDVFDWRETDTAGRWSRFYPDNVLFAKDDIENFIKIIENGRTYQQHEMEYALERIKEKFGTTDLAKLNELISDDEWESYYVTLYADLLTGRYTFDSMFYDTSRSTSKITDKLIDSIKKNPNDYALVLFDYHN